MRINMESKFFVPAKKPEDWRPLLAEPDKHWKPGYSAMALAHCWQEANDFPGSVKDVFRKSKVPLFQNVEMLVAFPEYKIPLPGGRTPSQSDIFVLARGGNRLISITVEGKVSEPFGDTVFVWFKNASPGKKKRLDFLCEKLQIENRENLDKIRYQLLHRTASAIIAAEKFNAPNALMLVHSFSDNKETEKAQFNDYCQFLELFDAAGEKDLLVKGKHEGINLFFAWVRGEKKYLKSHQCLSE